MAKFKMVCVGVQRISENGVLSNLVTMQDFENRHNHASFEEFKAPSEYMVAQEYEVEVRIKTDG